jgi:hypothetical protein
MYLSKRFFFALVARELDSSKSFAAYQKKCKVKALFIAPAASV